MGNSNSSLQTTELTPLNPPMAVLDPKFVVHEGKTMLLHLKPEIFAEHHGDSVGVIDVRTGNEVFHIKGKASSHHHKKAITDVDGNLGKLSLEI